MPKKLVSLGFALVALAAAGTLAPASATAPPHEGPPCPSGSHLLVCPTYSYCCPNNAFCICAQ
jgi:hypothetical protein